MPITQVEVQTLIEEYAEKAAELERNRKLGEGLFGITPGPADNPAHDKFVEDLRQMLGQFAAQDPPSEQVLPVLESVYDAAQAHQAVKSAYWMLMAVHGLTVDLIPRLNQADAAELLSRYEAQFPRRVRMPVQKQVISALKKQR